MIDRIPMPAMALPCEECRKEAYRLRDSGGGAVWCPHEEVGAICAVGGDMYRWYIIAPATAEQFRVLAAEFVTGMAEAEQHEERLTWN